MFGSLFFSGGVFALSTGNVARTEAHLETIKTQKSPKGPIEQIRASAQSTQEGVFEVSYMMHVLQKGITTTRVKPGFVIYHRHNKKEGQPHLEYYRLSPQEYVIDGTTKHDETVAHCSGKALLRLQRGDSVRLGLVRVPISPLYPKPFVKHATVFLKKTPHK